MEQTLSKDIQERLDKINWDSLKTKYGISKESIYSNPQIATQLAYGQMTDLVNGYTDDLTGKFSLRAYPQGDDKEWAVKVFTIDKPKTEADTLYVYGQPITSDSVKGEAGRSTANEGSAFLMLMAAGLSPWRSTVRRDSSSYQSTSLPIESLQCQSSR